MLLTRFCITLLLLYLVPTLASASEVLRFKLLPLESRILTQISHPFGTVNGEFTLREGEAKGDVQDLQGSGQVMLTIGMASYNSGFVPRDQDVQENYLEVEQYPMISFTSTGIEVVKKPKSLNLAWELMVKGLLELHGIKRGIRVPVKMTRQERKITVEGSVRILLEDFNIAIPSILFFRSGDSVEVTFRFVGEQQP